MRHLPDPTCQRRCTNEQLCDCRSLAHLDPTSDDMEDIGRTRYPGTSFILRYEAKLPSGRSPGFAMWGKSRLRVSYPGLGWQ